MSSKTTPPVLIFPGEVSRPLIQLPRVHDKFNEDFLQQLLASKPELLPIASIRQDVGSLLCVGREVSVPSGYIDNLYLSSSGYPVLVETKLWRNPEARREVLSQMLDYIKDLAKKDFEWFEEQWKITRKDTHFQDSSLHERICDLAQEEVNEHDFIDRINFALKRGDILAMIVGDGIESRLQDLVDHLCKDSAHLRYVLTLCELSFFQLGLSDSDGLIVVPRVVGNVEPVQRAYVRVDFKAGLEEKLTVTPVAVESKQEIQSARVTLSEDEFLRAVEATIGTDLQTKIELSYRDLIDSYSLEPDFTSAGLMLKIPDPTGEHPSASVLSFQKDGKVYNNRLFPGRMRNWLGFSPEIAQEVAIHYWEELHKIDDRFSENGLNHLSQKQFIPFESLYPKWPAIRDVVGAVTQRVREIVQAAEERR